MKEFKIDFKKEIFSELKWRIEYTRFPTFTQHEDWKLGTPGAFLKDVLSAWSNSSLKKCHWQVDLNF